MPFLKKLKRKFIHIAILSCLKKQRIHTFKKNPRGGKHRLDQREDTPVYQNEQKERKNT